jgi:hypothetical protein
MLRRDFETFFLGTAITISNRAGLSAHPKKRQPRSKGAAGGSLYIKRPAAATI